MDRYSLFQNIWIILLIWSLFYLGDYLLTIYSARNIKTRLNVHFEFERSFELNPVFEKDVNDLRLISPRHILNWLLSSGFLYFVWHLSAQYYFPRLFYFVVGEMILLEAAIHQRHFRNIALIKSYADGAITGHIKQKYWFSLKQSAWEMMIFFLTYLFFALAVNSWFFAGGAAGCLILAIRNHFRSNKARREDSPEKTASQG